MKRIIDTILVAAALSLSVSCQGILDIPSETSWGSGNFPSNESHLNGLLYGGYDYLQSALGSNYLRYGEARSDDFVLAKENNDTWRQILNNSLDTDISGSSWASFYNVIKQANVVLDNIDHVKEISGLENEKSLRGQALVMRAFSYFWIIRIWGDAPLVKTAYKNGAEIEHLSRSPQSEILEFIKEDLKTAKTLLSTSSYTRSTFSYYAACAIYAQVAAWEHDWPTVVSNADIILKNTNYKLASLFDPALDQSLATFMTDDLPGLEYVRMFNSSGVSEVLFELTNNYGDNENNDTLFGFLAYTNHPLKPNDDFVSMIEAGDWRYDVIFYNSDGSKINKLFVGYVRQASAHSVVLLRVSETMLLKAEALINMNDTETDNAVWTKNYEDAMEIINTIRERAGGPSLRYDIESYRDAGQEDLKYLVEKERQIELYCEGHRYFDLYRTGRLIEVMEPINGQNNLASFYWPINLTEIRRSVGHLEQNEYYK